MFMVEGECSLVRLIAQKTIMERISKEEIVAMIETGYELRAKCSHALRLKKNGFPRTKKNPFRLFLLCPHPLSSLLHLNHPLPFFTAIDG